MSRRRVECIDLRCVPLSPQPLEFGEFGSRSAVLSIDERTGAESRIVEAPSFWWWTPNELWPRDTEILVLTGTLEIDRWRLDAGGFLYLPAYSPVSRVEALNPCSFLWMTAAPSPIRNSPRGAAEHIQDVRTLAWQPLPDFVGRSAGDTAPGQRFKVIREDSETTAYTFMTHHDAGWADPRLESHATWEELILLEGDYLMGQSGRVVAGCYIFRPGEEPHGPQATSAGAVWLSRGEKRIDFDFTDSDWARRRVTQYLAADHGIQRSVSRPWGTWS